MRTKNPKTWTVRQCKQCSKDFETRKIYVNRGGGKFCSKSCATTYRNIHDNPTKCEEVRKKISENHADFSGKNNPMYGVRGKEAPGYIDGRNSMTGEVYRRMALIHLEKICYLCNEDDLNKLDVHHKDHNRKNNELSNLIFVCESCHQNVLHPRQRDTKGRYI